MGGGSCPGDQQRHAHTAVAREAGQHALLLFASPPCISLLLPRPEITYSPTPVAPPIVPPISLLCPVSFLLLFSLLSPLPSLFSSLLSSVSFPLLFLFPFSPSFFSLLATGTKRRPPSRHNK